jgi:ribonuclease R
MSKAKYSEIQSPHFGLGIEFYCHFTSPIRRLSDLATHRIIKKVILEGKPAASFNSYAKRAASAATEGELRAIAAERRIEDLYKCVYMSRFLGEEFDGRISAVTGHGLFVKLANTCEGLIPISEMPEEFRFDEKNVALVSKKRVYHLGEEIRVKLEECDLTRGKLRFSILPGRRENEK